jgi:hypothetical protein
MCKIRFPMLREWRRLNASDNKYDAEENIWTDDRGKKEDRRKLHTSRSNEELHNLYSSPNVFTEFTSKSLNERDT